MDLDPKKLASFTEYVLRPLTEDIRKILHEARRLQVQVTGQQLKDLAWCLGCWHLLGEGLRALTYLAIAWLVCQTVGRVLCGSPLSSP